MAWLYNFKSMKKESGENEKEGLRAGERCCWLRSRSGFGVSGSGTQKAANLKDETRRR